MSLMWSSILPAVESSVEIVCECLEDVTKPPEIVIPQCFPSSNMSIAFLDSSVENQKDTLNLTESTQISMSGASIVSKWNLVSFRVPIVCPFHHIFHSDKCHRWAEVTRSMDDSQATQESAEGMPYPQVV